MSSSASSVSTITNEPAANSSRASRVLAIDVIRKRLRMDVRAIVFWRFCQRQRLRGGWDAHLHVYFISGGPPAARFPAEVHMLLRTLAITILVSIPAVAAADTKCPTAVTDAAKKAFPDALITKCVSENSGFEVKMQKKDKSMVELDISAKGDI